MAKRKKDQITELAERIANDLLSVHGVGKAHRVKLMDAEDRYMGAWGPEPFMAAIETHLRKADIRLPS